MKILDLAISKNYIRSWTAIDGIRELTQNCIDEGNYNISYTGSSLILTNKNAKISIDKLVLGETTKYNDNTKVGKFGEGFKLGLLVLLRDGYKVTIINSGEFWFPFIAMSETYNVETLHCKIEEANTADEVSFVISDCEDLIENLMEQNLIIRKIITGTDLDTQETDYGKIIFNEDFKGKIYVNGLYVQTDENMRYGFDFLPSEIELDRDRKAINLYELRAIVAKTIIQSKRMDVVYASFKDSNLGEEIIENIIELDKHEINEFRDLYAKDKRIDFEEEPILLVDDNVAKFLSTYSEPPCKYKTEKSENVRTLINKANDLQFLEVEIVTNYEEWNTRKNQIPLQLSAFNSSQYKFCIAMINKYKNVFTEEETRFMSNVKSNKLSTWEFNKIIALLDFEKINFENYKLEDLLLEEEK